MWALFVWTDRGYKVTLKLSLVFPCQLRCNWGVKVVQGGGGEMTPRCLLYSSDCLHVYQIACQNCSVIIIQVRVCCHSEDAYKPGVLFTHLRNWLHTGLRPFVKSCCSYICKYIFFNKIQKPNLVLVSVCLICFNLLNSEIPPPPAAKETSTTLHIVCIAHPYSY